MSNLGIHDRSIAKTPQLEALQDVFSIAQGNVVCPDIEPYKEKIKALKAQAKEKAVNWKAVYDEYVKQVIATLASGGAIANFQL